MGGGPLRDADVTISMARSLEDVTGTRRCCPDTAEQVPPPPTDVAARERNPQLVTLTDVAQIA